MLADGNSSVGFSQLCHPSHLLTSHKFPLHKDPKSCYSSKWPMLLTIKVTDWFLGKRWLPDWVLRSLEGRLFLPVFFWTKWLLIKSFVVVVFIVLSNWTKHCLFTTYISLQLIILWKTKKRKEKVDLLEGFLKQELLLWKKIQILMYIETRNLRVTQPKAADPH